MKLIVDAEDAVVGRLGSYVAKELLKGNEVVVVNSEKAIISGDKKGIIGKINKLRKMGRGGSLKGPKISKLPDRLLKRMIRGMLPWDKTKGRQAYKRLRCHPGSGMLKKEDLKNIKKIENKKFLKFMTIKQISEML